MDIRVRRAIGGGMWGVGLLVAVVWGSLQGAGVEGRGYGFAPAVEVAALETARVGSLTVELHELVEATDVVVRMDTSPLDEERDWASAQLLAVQQLSASEARNDARRFAEGVEDVLVDRARLATQLQEDRARMATLEERLSVELDLANSGASSEQAVEEWRRQIRVVEARVRAGSQALAVVSDAANAARERGEPVPVGEGEPWEVVAASRELDMIQGRIDRMSLRAGVQGQVTWIYRTEGEVVPAGEPILQVRRTGTRDVVAFVAPAEASGLEQGESATVRRATGEVLRGRLVSVGSGPNLMPEALWYNPTYPEYAVPVRIELDHEIGPDEPVTVRL
jgi:multidrug resistance efflux pump